MEQSIGTLKRGYHFYCMSYVALKKGNMELLHNVTAFNVKKVPDYPRITKKASLKELRGITNPV